MAECSSLTTAVSIQFTVAAAFSHTHIINFTQPWTYSTHRYPKGKCSADNKSMTPPQISASHISIPQPQLDILNKGSLA